MELPIVGDMIEVYKIISNIYDSNTSQTILNFREKNTINLRGHQFTLEHKRLYTPSRESTVPRKDNNWRTLVIKPNSIANKKAQLAAIAEYCDPDLMLISETKLSPDILNGEFVPEGYMGRFRKDRKRGAGGVMIISKECYKIVDADITVQNENESVWAIITLKDLSK